MACNKIELFLSFVKLWIRDSGSPRSSKTRYFLLNFFICFNIELLFGSPRCLLQLRPFHLYTRSRRLLKVSPPLLDVQPGPELRYPQWSLFYWVFTLGTLVFTWHLQVSFLRKKRKIGFIWLSILHTWPCLFGGSSFLIWAFLLF